MTRAELKREIDRALRMRQMSTDHLVYAIECSRWDWADLWSDDLLGWRRTQQFWEETRHERINENGEKLKGEE